MRKLIFQAPGASFLLVAACLVIVVQGLRAAEPILVPLLVAVFLAILSSPLMGWLRRRRVPLALAVVATVLANLAVVAGLALLVGGSFTALSKSIPKYRQSLERQVDAVDRWLQARNVDLGDLSRLEAGSRQPSPTDPAAAEPVEPPAGEGEVLGPGPLSEPPSLLPSFLDLNAVTDFLTRTLLGIYALLSNTVLVLLIMIFILLEAAGLPQKLQVAFGWEKEHMARLAKAKREVQRYLSIKTLISAATGLLIYLWVWLLGVDFPLVWGLVAFFLNYIPNLGSILAAIPAVLLAGIELGLGRALLVALGYLAVNLVLGNLVDPYLMGRRLGLSTLVVFLSLLFWGWVWGPVGMLLSVPLTMILKIVLENTRDFRWLAHLLDPNPQAQKSLPS